MEERISITVGGIDILGQHFKEETVTLVVSCHGCSYSSKHHVARNSVVSLDVPATSDLPLRTITARVVWIQRPHSVKELFVIALEFATPRNVWDVTFPPPDWLPRWNEIGREGKEHDGLAGDLSTGTDGPLLSHGGALVASVHAEGEAARGSSSETRYDVALSFAGEDREYVEQTAEILRSRGVKTFYDKHEVVTLWGKNLYTHLDEIYRQRARYTVMFISKYYAVKTWTKRERESAQARAFEETREYILPARFDSTEIPGLLPTIGHIDLRCTPPSELAELIIQKLRSS